MAKKPTVTTLASGFNSTETLNSNFNNIADAFDNTLSLDGSTPNAMGADLDLNSNNIINATAIMVGGSDVVATTAAALAAATQAQVDADAAVVASALSETNAANSATASQTSANASQASRLASELAETNAETAETNAETAETNSQTSATNSAASANAALGSQNAASSSAAAALASQVDANTSQGNASVSALAASNSETAAALSESNAATSETNAATSETNAAASETNAATSETAAAASEAAAATSETNAATSETNAAASAVTATTGATTATAQAVIATDQATQAAADVASIQGAAGSAVDAANSAAAAAAALDNFDDRYLGPKSSEPTLDNDGDALVSGSLYFSTTSNAMQVYDGANWIAASASGVASMILYEYTATAGQTTFTGADDNSNSISFIQGNEIVVLNGIILDPSDYTSTSGTSIVLDVGAAVSDLLNVYAFKSFTVADTVSASTGGTFGGDVTVTGTLAATTLTGDGSAITGLPAGYTDTDVATYLAGTSPTVGGLTTTADVSFGDNDKAVFGAGSDLQIYHDGSNSYIYEGGTGSLKIQAVNLNLQSTTGESYIDAVNNGSVYIYHDNAAKLATTSTGIDVTGIMEADNITVANTTGAYVSFPYSGQIKKQTGFLEIAGWSTTTGVKTTTSGKDRIYVDTTGDISFYEDTGTTPKFFWDASAESLGIGTSSPAHLVDAISTTGSAAARFGTTYNTGSNDGTVIISNGGSGDAMLRFDYEGSNTDRARIGVTASDQHLQFFTAGNNERMRIDSSGNLLVGKTALSTSAVGTQIESFGLARIVRSGGESLVLNRTTSDGTIASFQKDGSTVGSIGVNAGDNVYISGSAANHAGIAFATNSVIPMRTGVAIDNTIDNGSVSFRWKDGHYSGTVNATSFAGDGSGLTGVGASTAFGAVGTYYIGGWLLTNYTHIAGGSTVAGSGIYDEGSSGAVDRRPLKDYYSSRTLAGLSGTWRIMSGPIGNYPQDVNGTLFVRIA